MISSRIMNLAGFGKLQKVLGLIVLVLITGCETDVNINAEYDDIPVVYGLIDVTDSAHYVRINKTFLGTGDANEMALVRDSSEYQGVSATIGHYPDYAPQTPDRVYELYPVEITDKDTGVFYAPNQTVYRFDADNLPSSGKYRLDIDLDEGRKQISATTELVQYKSLFNDIIFQAMKLQGMRFADSEEVLDGYEINLTPPIKSKRLNIVMTFRYVDVIADGSNFVEEEHFITWDLGTKIIANTDNPQKVFFKISGDQFFESVVNQVPDFDQVPNLFKRIPDVCDFQITVAGEDLHYYMEVNEPSGELNQEKPEYTNIEGGVGIFSSRLRMTYSTTQFTELRLSDLTLNELSRGLIVDGLGAKNFCHSNLPAGEPTSCN